MTKKCYGKLIKQYAGVDTGFFGEGGGSVRVIVKLIRLKFYLYVKIKVQNRKKNTKIYIFVEVNIMYAKYHMSFVNMVCTMRVEMIFVNMVTCVYESRNDICQYGLYMRVEMIFVNMVSIWCVYESGNYILT